MSEPGPRDLLVPPAEDADAVSASSRRLRIAALIVLVVFVSAGLLGVFGVRSSTARGSDGPLTAEVEHAGVARAGLAMPFTISLQRAGGFEGPVEVRVSTDYMSRIDEHGLDPEPDSVANDGEWLTWRWDEIEGDTHEVDFDGRLEPGVHWRFGGAVQVRTASELIHVDVDTWVAP
jgi:hypothetical protein